jgi:preprotein translocase subunit SecD
LSIGVAVDANVLMFERLKRNYGLANASRQLARDGGNLAFHSRFEHFYIDYLCNTILVWQRIWRQYRQGFSLTLAIGVGVSMFTAIIVTETSSSDS